ncbi:MAG TPA: endonuclease/exonuclease/phosphatase family protein [Lacipirellulaceae bacterium]|jgi:endonuclease/exonuclease/phosphatase family metal-dependent hydrolase|nr:endonuclease/exonuclease/phosphatase family protein [Lacipirellulaceae bacterium]
MPTLPSTALARALTHPLRFSATAFACALLALCPTTIHAELPTELRIVTYNIRHGEGMDHKIDLERIAKVLNDLKPDIVALEEVDQGTKRASGVDQPAELAKLTGMKAYFGHNIDFDGGGYGTAVLTKLPVKHAESVKLKSFYASTPKHAEQRGVQVLKIGTKDDADLWFLCTHLDYRGPDDERMDSAHTINDLVENHGNQPAIIAGDFNATPDSAPLKEFAKEWKIAGEEPSDKNAGKYFTFPADKPDHRIDYVLCRPAKDWQVVEVRVIDEPVASDHRPVLTVLKKAS